MTGDDDSTPAPRQLADKLNGPDKVQNERAILYGWPTVVIEGHNRVPWVAPLFVVRIEPEQDSAGTWCLHATWEPEFNLAVTASGLFDPSTTEEIAELLGGGLPFGDAEAFTGLSRAISELLGLNILSQLNPATLELHVGRKEGVYNAAVSVLAGKSEFNAALLKELRQLQAQDDWETTAAAHLVPGAAAPKRGGQPPTAPLAAPLPCYRSQEQALESLRQEPLTVVTGPPGTGKTQLVVNAVANAWLDGDTVLVASTNNAAVNVAVERSQQDICGGLLIRTGNRDIRLEVPGLVTAALGQAKRYEDDQAEARAELNRAAAARAELMEKLARLDKLDQALLSVTAKLETTGSELQAAAQALWPGANPPGALPGSDKIERWAGRVLRAWFFRRFRTRRLRRRLGCIDAASLEQLVTWAQLDQRQSELIATLESGRAEHRWLETDVGDLATSVPNADGNWAEASLRAIRADAAAHLRSAIGRLGVFGGAPRYGGEFRNIVGSALDDLRGWACTALSASSNFPLRAGLFDLVIVDEASQCSLAAVLPLAYRAKRLAVVGDPRQLRPIVPLDDRQLRKITEEVGFDSGGLSQRGIHHRDGSAYLAFEFSARPDVPVLLNEHYRCHPHIARWFNRTFYNDELTVLTNVEEKDRPILWRDVEGTAERPNSRGSWRNCAEAKQTVERLGVLMEAGLSVGVVTPFVAQARLIAWLADKHIGRPALNEAGFVCGTAHRLQGDERDAIVISAVLSPGMSKSGIRWMESERNLLNVAVSRARRALIVFGHPSVGDLGSPTLASLRTYLRDEITRDEGDAPPLANYHLASGAENLLLDAMQRGGLAPYAKIDVQGYELDFALMDRGIKLNIEVDGDQHLDARVRQRRQDLTRDRLLYGLGWTVLRIPAWRCHGENIGSVIAEIEKARDRLLDESTLRHC